MILPEHFKIYFRSSYAQLLQGEPAAEATKQAEERAGSSEDLPPPPPPSGDLPSLLQADMAHAKKVSWNFLGVEEAAVGGGRVGGGGGGGNGDEHGAAHGGGGGDEGEAVTPCEDAVRMAEVLRSCSALVGMHPDQAAEAIVDFGLAMGVPFAVVPCCVHGQVRGPDIAPQVAHD